MYYGRSIGRMIEWLRRLTPHADLLMFGHSDGSIRIHDKVIARRVTWDYYDTPTFAFVDECLNQGQEELREDILRSEHNLLHYRLSDVEVKALRGLKKKAFYARDIRKTDRPAALCSLLERSLVNEVDEFAGWKDEGAPFFDIRIEITPQALGFLDYLDKIEKSHQSASHTKVNS